MAPARRRFAAIVAASALLLAACGGDTTNTDLATIDDGSVPASDVSSSDGAELDADAPVGLAIIDDDDSLGPIPDAVTPPEPGVAASPAERQRLQELGLVDQSLAAPAMPAVPGADDRDGLETPTQDERPAATRNDLDQFPAEIPAIVPGAPNGPSAAGSPSPLSSAPNFSFAGDTGADATGGLDPLAADADLGLPGGDTAVTQLGSASFSVDDETPDNTAAEALALEASEACRSGDACTDLALQSGSGVGDAAAGSVEIVDPGVGGEGSEPDVPSDDRCAARPYDRGCPLPTSDAGGPSFGDDDDDDLIDSARQGDGEGVDVPQAVIDALLAPVDGDEEWTDNEDDAEDDGDASDDDASDGDASDGDASDGEEPLDSDTSID